MSLDELAAYYLALGYKLKYLTFKAPDGAIQLVDPEKPLVLPKPHRGIGIAVTAKVELPETQGD